MFLRPSEKWMSKPNKGRGPTATACRDNFVPTKTMTWKKSTASNPRLDNHRDYQEQTNQSQIAISQLTITASFFAVRSCKYVKYSQQEEKQCTDIVKLYNLCFFKNRKLVIHENKWKHNTVTHMVSGDITLCPVCAGVAIVWRLRSYTGATDDTPISALWKYNWTHHIRSTQITNALRDAVVLIREDVLHINREAIGTH